MYKSILKSYIQTYLKLIGRRAARRHLATSASPPRYCNQSQHSESSTTTLTQQTQHVPPTAQQGLLPQTHSQFPRLLTEGDKYSEITLLPSCFLHHSTQTYQQRTLFLLIKLRAEAEKLFPQQMHLTYVSTEISNCLLNPQFQSKEKKNKFNYVTLITDSLSTAVAAET